ncbi:MAG TPA: tripartite tricarboxylate transporter substrate-binding protein [Candidatus Eisenbacteria bacterium]|jgi:tripartite-type tricarboxylate transporter receptor subunit TctC|nr:tripartite tricarboxylate transporter substrate-binding protein [Candidatus Eisenbacteria bacterium]
MKRHLFVLMWLFFTPPAWAQAPFYEGKTITVIAGVSAGSAYDLYARLMAQFMGKHIAGNPSFVVQNMTGAGSIIGANYVYNVSKPDGLTIGAIQPSIYFNQLMKQKEVRYDWAKFGWIGSSDKSDYLLYMRADLPYKTLADVRKAKEPPKCGSTGAGTSGSYMPKLLEETLGTKFAIVAGYQGGGEIDLAVERGELHCRAFTVQAYHSREPYFTWRKNGFARILMQTGQTRDARLADVPTLGELMDQFKTPDRERRLVPLVMAATDFGRPIVAPPGTPAERLKILREAFLKTMKDPELLAEAKRKNFDITPSTGEELESLAKLVMNQPQEIVARVKILMEQ